MLKMHGAALEEQKKCKHSVKQTNKQKKLRPFEADEHSTDMTHIWVNTASIYNKTMLHHHNYTEKNRMQ